MNQKSLLITTAILAISAVANAGTTTADFNDNTPGPLGAFNPGEGQTGGTGFDDFETWGNTGTINIISGDLTAPPATNYTAAQTGTPQSAQGTFTGGRQTTRALAEPMSGTVWFSFLLNQPTNNSRGGITFNQNGNPGDPRIVATGVDLRLGLATIQPPGGGTNGIFTIGETALVLGRLVIEPLGDEILDVWVNPDVSVGAANLPPSDNFLVQDAASFDFGIERVGLQSYSSDNQGGIIDHLRISDSPNAFEVVTSTAGVVLDDPNLVVTTPSPIFGTLPDQERTATRSITIENRGATQDLVISDAEPTGFDAGHFLVTSTLPLTIPPDGSGQIDVAFDAGASALLDFEASLTISSNDSTTPDTIVDIPVTLFDSTVSLVPNGDFEDPNFFAEFWTQVDIDVIDVPGLAPGSNTAAFLSTNNQTLGQTTPNASANWYLDFYFAVRDTTNRAMSVFVGIGAIPGGSTINLRYQSGAFNTFAAGSWGGDLGLGSVEPSIDADANGSLDDPGDTKNVYRMRITGNGWGTGDSSYDLQLSDANADAFTRSAAGITRYQAGSGNTAPPASFSFNSIFGNGPGYWVDDVTFFNLPAADDPNLAVASPNPLFGTLPVDSPGETRTLVLSNAGATQDLVVTGATLSGPDADHFTVLTDPLPTLAPGALGDIDIAFDPKGETGSFDATLTVASNDTSTPSSPLALPTTVYNTGTVITVNGSFDEPGFLSPAWGIAGPNLDFGSPVATAAPGLSVTSSASAFVEGFGSVLGQALIGPPDWYLDFLVAIQENDFRGFQMNIHNLGNATRTTDTAINFRYEFGSFAVSDKATNTWIELPELGPVALSVDTNSNGSLDDPGDTKNVHRIRITGRAWGTPAAEYDISISDANNTAALARSAAFLNFWGSGLGDGRSSPPTSFVFHTLDGDNPGFWVDDTVFTAGIPPFVPAPTTDLRITSIERDNITNEFTLTWTVSAGKTYTLESSTGLVTWSPVDTNLPGPSYADTLPPVPTYYRVREE